MALTGKIISFQIGKPQLRVFSGLQLDTAMDKKMVKSSLVTKKEIKGDGIGNRKSHGGPDRVICFYPYEHYAMWEELWGRKLPVPAFGENITVAGMKEKQVYIGDIFKIGECLVQITQGRIPCATISYFNGEPDFLKKVIETSFTGYFARVLEEGTLNNSDSIELVQRMQDRVSVLYGNEVYFHGKDGLEGLDKLLGVTELADVWKSKAEQRRDSLSSM
ncbi:MOSC domain-containing protein [Peribacillus cavernae]|uniref:MOSC domain-containing protein n=1 Tax=Peribacillus cavernae TaxID=1674310 RepID=A0A433HW51_9BACI|nr:MOSC domain-containing protein [Peribacillus cavernae]MDQ0217879.1 MOSC domain-containing protein YiiM [Peribacillus cavernae]RUQ32543.1 MOSC domain-containing protein [Peribacillus cavernae]